MDPFRTVMSTRSASFCAMANRVTPSCRNTASPATKTVTPYCPPHPYMARTMTVGLQAFIATNLGPGFEVVTDGVKSCSGDTSVPATCQSLHRILKG